MLLAWLDEFSLSIAQETLDDKGSEQQLSAKFEDVRDSVTSRRYTHESLEKDH